MKDVALMVSEHDWLSDPVKALEHLFQSMSDDELRLRIDNLRLAQEILIWNDKYDPIVNTATAILTQTKRDCAPKSALN